MKNEEIKICKNYLSSDDFNNLIKWYSFECLKDFNKTFLNFFRLNHTIESIRCFINNTTIDYEKLTKNSVEVTKTALYFKYSQAEMLEEVSRKYY